MIRVLLADDEPLMRVGIRTILSSDPGITVVAEASDGREAAELAGRHRPDVALLDIQMPGTDGFTAITLIRRASPATTVAMLTTFSRDEYVSRALDDGASGFLLKAAAPRELITGVRAVAEGGAFLSPKVTRRVITGFRNRRENRAHPAHERISALSPRERQVLALLGAGLSNAEIARELHLVEDTVKTHVSAVYARIGVKNRVQAAIIAHDTGLSADR
ncbi:response regulator [Actinorugispora endophytica]|uniref:LuxR family two component transcriptional regulator n=1 Tax=Actinorugispora endophytica TaxID=1605990 RepID=A0A4R6V8S9_9ACTN|nr:response regulator transcription factor [Actinorugispora endophytica]TDQ55178.1 LuxR family two component transcriptional regulator [Actinorugispora endophytica]